MLKQKKDHSMWKRRHVERNKDQWMGYISKFKRTDSLEKILMLGELEGGRRRGQQRMRWVDREVGDGQESELVLCRPIMVENIKTEIALRQCSEDAHGP